MFAPEFLRLAANVLDAARAQQLKIVTAESCTGGMIAACLTEIPGSSDVVECGFVVYSDAAKSELLGVPPSLLASDGAVSEAVARAMAAGALQHSRVGLAAAVTGIAGPGGGSTEKPVGLVHIAAARAGKNIVHEEHRFGDAGRDRVRLKTVEAALNLLLRAM